MARGTRYNIMSSSLSVAGPFSPGTPVFPTNKTDCYDIAEIVLKVTLNTIHLMDTVSQFCLATVRPRRLQTVNL